ncbi:MAG: tetratricopeptide repeat protein [Cyclobacteriaceae bacterium]
MYITKLRFISFAILISCFSASFVNAQWGLFKKDGNVNIENHSNEGEKYFIEGEKYFILEDYSKAYVLFLKALEVEPENAAINFKLAETLANNNELEKSLTYAKKAVELNPKNKYYYLLAAQIQGKLGNYAEATNLYEAMIQNVTGTEEHYFELANLYIMQEQYEKALEIYNKAEEVFGINDQVVLQKQKLYIKLGDLKNALKEGEKLIELFPQEVNYYLSQADVLLSNDKLKEGIEYLLQAIELEPGNAKANLLLSDAYKKTGEIQKSRQSLQKAFASPEIDLNMKVQVVLDLFNQFPDAELEKYCRDLIENLIDAHPEEGMAYAIYGDYHFKLQNLDLAREKYINAIDKGHNNFNIWQNVIQIGLNLQQYEQVVKDSDKALESFPNQALLYMFNGTAHFLLKNHEEAVAVLEHGKKLASGNLQILSMIAGQLGDAYHSLEQYEKSDDAYQTALDANPDNDHVLNNYSYYLALRKENLDLARKMSTKLIKRNPDAPNYLDTHAWVLYMQGDYSQAKKIIEKALQEDASGTIIEHYGDILYKLGDIDGAVKQWQRAKGMDETSELIDKKIADRKLYE